MEILGRQGSVLALDISNYRFTLAALFPNFSSARDHTGNILCAKWASLVRDGTITFYTLQ